MFLRSPYNYDTDQASLETAIDHFGDSPTQQQFKDDCNINRIVKQYAAGVQPIGNAAEPLPDGFYDHTTYQEAMNLVRRGQEAFNALSAATRAQFSNDPGAFVDFATNPANLPALREMGLAPQVAPTQNPPQSPPPQGGPEGVAQ